jgi:hypothetical protein
MPIPPGPPGLLAATGLPKPLANRTVGGNAPGIAGPLAPTNR